MKINKYGGVNTHDVYKFFAIMFMMMDHIGQYLLEGHTVLRMVGRIAMPIFATIYGYHFKDKIGWRLLPWAVALSAADFYVKGTVLPLNILFAFFFGSIFGIGLNKYKDSFKQLDLWLIFIFSLMLHVYFKLSLEYGCFVFWFMTCGYIFKHYKENKHNSLFVLGIFILYFVDQSFGIGLTKDLQTNSFYLPVLFVLTLLSLVALKKYRLESYSEISIPWMRGLVMFLGRYSLQIYVIHLGILRLVDYWMRWGDQWETVISGQ